MWPPYLPCLTSHQNAFKLTNFVVSHWNGNGDARFYWKTRRTSRTTCHSRQNNFVVLNVWQEKYTTIFTEKLEFTFMVSQKYINIDSNVGVKFRRSALNGTFVMNAVNFNIFNKCRFFCNINSAICKLLYIFSV